MEDPDGNYGELSLVVIKAARACNLRCGYCCYINEDTGQYGTSISEGTEGQEVGGLCVVDPEANGEELIDRFRELGIPFCDFLTPIINKCVEANPLKFATDQSRGEGVKRFLLSALGAWVDRGMDGISVRLFESLIIAVRSVYWFDVNETVASAYKLTYTTSPYTARSLLTSVQKYVRDALLDGKWNRERPFAEG